MIVIQVGIVVVFILMAAESIQSILHYVEVDVHLCYWILIIGAAVTPFTWLDSPKDIWWVNYGGMRDVYTIRSSMDIYLLEIFKRKFPLGHNFS